MRCIFDGEGLFLHLLMPKGLESEVCLGPSSFGVKGLVEAGDRHLFFYEERRSNLGAGY